MINLEAKDFNDAWFQANAVFLPGYHGNFEDGNSPDCMDIYHGLRCLSIDNRITIRGKACDLNPGLLTGYKPAKWKHLVKKYLDIEQLKWIKSLILRKSSRKHAHLTFQYNFKVNMGRSSNGSCILGLIFLVDNKNKTVRVDMISRVSEVTRRMMLDYILVYRVMEYLLKPDYWDYKFTIFQYSNIMYQSGMMIPLCSKLFKFKTHGISSKGVKHKSYWGRIEYQWFRYLNGLEKKFAQAKVIGDVIRQDKEGIERPDMPMESMVLDSFLVEKPQFIFKKGQIVELKSEVQFKNYYQVKGYSKDGKVNTVNLKDKKAIRYQFFEVDLKPSEGPK